MDFLSPLIEKVTSDLSAGRMIESFVLLTIIWRKLSPHLKKVEERLEGLEKAVKEGFNSGEQRFEKIEGRIFVLEQNKTQNQGEINGKSIRV